MIQTLHKSAFPQDIKQRPDRRVWPEALAKPAQVNVGPGAQRDRSPPSRAKCVLNRSPDIGPTGSVGKKQDRSFILGQTRHYPKDHTFDAFQNVSSGKRRDRITKMGIVSSFSTIMQLKEATCSVYFY